MPVTITRPRAPRIRSAAATKAIPRPLPTAVTQRGDPTAPASSVRTAEATKSLPCVLVGLSVRNGLALAMG